MLRSSYARTAVLGAALALVLAGCGESPEARPTPVPDTPIGPGPEPPAAQTGGWRAAAELPQPRTEHSAVALDGLVYVAGGFAAGGPLPTELYIYHPDTDSWRQGAPIPAGRHHAPLAAYDGSLYLVGGYSGGAGGNWQPADTLFVYDVDSDSWREGPPMPEPRGAHAVAVTEDGQLHVVGGVDGGARSEHFVFDTATETWSTLPELPPPGSTSAPRTTTV